MRGCQRSREEYSLICYDKDRLTQRGRGYVQDSEQDLTQYSKDCCCSVKCVEREGGCGGARRRSLCYSG